MIRAILAGKKTMTRRILRMPPSLAGADINVAWPDAALWGAAGNGGLHVQFGDASHRVRCPYGQPGDTLWVKETWAQRTDGARVVAYNADGQIRSPIDIGGEIVSTHRGWLTGHPEPARERVGTWLSLAGSFGGKWRPSIHMPRWASRLTLRITSVRVERLQDISEADIIAEGLTQDVLCDMLAPLAARVSVKPEHWISGEYANGHGISEGESYCYKCCAKEVRKINREGGEANIDGGGRGESDVTPYCETCGHRLNACLTDYGAKEEIRHYLDNWDAEMICPSTALDLIEMANVTKIPPSLMWRAAWDCINGDRAAWATNPYVWVVTFECVRGAS